MTDTDIQSIKCEACRRLLPPNQYAIDRARPSGINPRCKDCDNYRRRRRYRKSAPKDADIHLTPLIIYPLREHNRGILDSQLCGRSPYSPHSKDVSIWGTEVNRGVGFSITLSSVEAYECRVLVHPGKLSDGTKGELLFGIKYLGINREEFRDMVLEALVKRDIRLHVRQEMDI